MPPEDPDSRDPDKCGELLQSMYGMRDAAANWEAEYTRLLEKSGYIRGKASPCHFRSSNGKCVLLVHGDDFLVAGPEAELQTLRSILDKD